MVLEVFNIRLTDEWKREIRDARRLGLNILANELSGEILDAGANLGISALKSAVPIDTLELRGRSFNDGMIRSKRVNQYAVKVFITDDTHYGRFNRPIAASELAAELDNGISEKGAIYHRSQDSAPISSISQRIGGFSTIPKDSLTAGWIGRAEDELEAKIGGVLAKLVK